MAMTLASQVVLLLAFRKNKALSALQADIFCQVSGILSPVSTEFTEVRGNKRGREELLLAKTRVNDSLAVEALLSEGASPNCADETGDTPIHLAASTGHSRVLTILLHYNADLSVRNNSSFTPLMCAASNGHATCMRQILEKLENSEEHVNARDQLGRSVLSMTASSGHEAVLQVLLTTQLVDLDATDLAGMTALHHALLHNHLGAFWMLLEAGANPRTQDKCGNTPLMAATVLGHRGVVEELIECECNVNVVSSRTFTALYMAVRMDFVGIAKALVKAGADVNVCDELGNTPVTLAARLGRHEMASLLIDAGCDLTLNSSLLHHAAFFGWRDIAQVLLAKGLDPNIGNTIGNTPVVLAVRNNHFDIVKLLLEYNCDMHSARNKGDYTLLITALKRGRRDLCMLVYEAGCVVRRQDVAQIVSELHPLHATGVADLDWIEQVLAAPRTLRSSCRLVLRSTLGLNVRTHADQLPLPSFLKDYLSFDDIRSKDV